MTTIEFRPYREHWLRRRMAELRATIPLATREAEDEILLELTRRMRELDELVAPQTSEDDARPHAILDSGRAS